MVTKVNIKIALKTQKKDMLKLRENIHNISGRLSTLALFYKQIN